MEEKDKIKLIKEESEKARKCIIIIAISGFISLCVISVAYSVSSWAICHAYFYSPSDVAISNTAESVVREGR